MSAHLPRPPELVGHEASNPKYELYHPKWYRKRYPIFWWLERFSYRRFIARELTSLAVGYAAVLVVVQVWVLARGPQAFERYVQILGSPAMLAFHGLMLVALLFHSVTWLNLAPKALVLRLRHRRVPDAAVLVGHYVGWLAATALVIWYLAGS